MPETAQQSIRRLFNSNVTDSRHLYSFNLFDRSVSQKLWAINYYLDKLLSLDINQFQVPSMSVAGSSMIIQPPNVDTPDYCRHLNLYLDGFFMNTMSVLDTLAHELFLLYENPARSRDIYIKTAVKMFQDSHPNTNMRTLLEAEMAKPWFGNFEPFRHCTTHESLIRYDDIKVGYDDVLMRHKLLRLIKLPDNPKTRPFSYFKNRVATRYCQSLFIKISWLIDKVYSAVLRDISANGNTIPIPIP